MRGPHAVNRRIQPVGLHLWPASDRVGSMDERLSMVFLLRFKCSHPGQLPEDMGRTGQPERDAMQLLRQGRSPQ